MSSNGHPVFLAESELDGLLSMSDGIEVLRAAHYAYAEGRAGLLPRAHLRRDDSILHAVGGFVEDTFGVKAWLYTSAGASPVLNLFDASDGRVLAVLEAFRLGQLRTAATAGLGTDLLARKDAQVLGLLGTGKQAQAQAMAIAAVRPIRLIKLFGRDPRRRTELAEKLRADLELEVIEASTIEEAFDDADVVTAVTRASDPIVSGSLLSDGLHLNAVGAIVRGRRELDADALARCDRVVVDSLEQARTDSGELVVAVEEGALEWDRVRALGDVVADAPPRRPDEVTLNKNVGVGFADVAIGRELLRRLDLGLVATAAAGVDGEEARIPASTSEVKRERTDS